jgi:hypothetical protein
MRLLDRLEPTLGSEEEGYRLHFLSVDRAQAAGSVLIALALVLGVFVLELNFFGRQQLVPIAIVRVLFFAFSGVLYLSARGIENSAALEDRRRRDRRDGARHVRACADASREARRACDRPDDRIRARPLARTRGHF